MGVGDEIYEEKREMGSGSSRVEVAKRANRGGREGGASLTGSGGTGGVFCSRTAGIFLVENLRRKPAIAS